ncbi:uncharacterized protein DUF4245 [Actinomadura pelletieri DSM 43383]|uniref:Uncharacterized protein DUF4245 n=1 Tax=Actinomadura pelletieri DSM 43383 TaxID=1120940 RepID=A0A495QIK6_9ACTN|nr:DUF4245 domain-containing protein [Actinomadura pelletieri]RKS72000.1 uncharacterized protein DUF4245 [Actinomadura pelletieri DSM 43383]
MTDKRQSSVSDTEAQRADASQDAHEDAPGDVPEGAPAGRPVIEVSPGTHKRLTTGLGGFTMAMGACLLLVLVIYAITPRSDEEVLPTVDYGSQLWVMRNDAPYTVHAPEGLPARWRPTSSRVHGLDGADKQKPVAWHLGFVTPNDEYAALEQSNEKASEYVPRMANSSKPTGTHQVNGVAWTKYHRKDKKANSLARTLPDGVSIVVTGTASYEELAVLAASLKPQTKNGAGLTPKATATPGS